jgi:hypothetical protein
MGISQVLTNVIKSNQGSIPEVPVRKNRAARTANTATRSDPSLTIGNIISAMPQAPRHSMLLGRCADGLPFLLTLRDPALGSILISGDQDCGKTHQLQVMADSAIRLNAPHELQVAILTHHPEEWVLFQTDQRRKRYLQEISAWYNGRADHLIRELTELAEARQAGASMRTALLFILDDINFIENLSYEAQVNLHWLLAYGPQSGIWPLATLKACYAPDFRYWIETFRTHIIGKIASKLISKSVTRQPNCQAHHLEPGLFRVWTGKGWSTYNLPLLGD